MINDELEKKTVVLDASALMAEQSVDLWPEDHVQYGIEWNLLKISSDSFKDARTVRQR